MNRIVQCSTQESKSKVYTFTTKKSLADFGLESSINFSGKLQGLEENRGVFNFESKTNISQNRDIDSGLQNQGQQHQTGIVDNRGLFAHTNEQTHELTEEKQPLLFTRKQIGDRNERRSTRAKFRSYSKLTIRKQSFIGWTSECMLQIWQFAMAGFFYKGFADIVACFECGLVHRQWQKDDDPVKIHIQLQPDCPYIMDLVAEGIQSCEDLQSFESNNCEEDMEMNDTCIGRNNVVTATASISSQDPPTDKRLLCKICLTNPLQITNQPCGHFAMCESCYTRIRYKNNKCPICRCPIKNTIRTFVP
ncbi:baculoviral IAP repeat-containing protein 7-B-like [Mytilus edulis]|uniref:baculoviral IAP repeat-containing protein 7-B-like n=1 Tax=Mytilus edulis TaxID=6550 RepID=UPI0039F01F28